MENINLYKTTQSAHFAYLESLAEPWANVGEPANKQQALAKGI